LVERTLLILDRRYDGYFVDLYVRKSNLVGVQMYEKMGYVIYRTVLGYYAGGDGEEQEDARDMRKSLKRDPKKLSMQPYPGGTIRPHELKDSL
jgi:N-terminal acetyltransferase B complex catalytic subunit